MRKISFFVLAVIAMLVATSCDHSPATVKNGAADADSAKNTTAKSTTIKDDSASQEKMLDPKFDPDKLCGIGIFKIGASKENTIGVLRKTGKYAYVEKHEASNEGLPENGYVITKILPPTLKTMVKGSMTIDYYTYYNDTTEAFFIGKYDVGDIRIEMVLVEYYRNKLISIRHKKTQEIEKVLITKYGEPQNKVWHNKDVVTNEDWTIRNEAFYTHIYGSDKFLRGICDAWYNAKKPIIDSAVRSKAKNL